MPNLTYTTKRVISGIAFVLCLLSIVNYYFGVGMLWQFRKEILIVIFIAVVPIASNFMPTMQEMREHRASKQNK